MDFSLEEMLYLSSNLKKSQNFRRPFDFKVDCFTLDNTLFKQFNLAISTIFKSATTNLTIIRMT